MKVGDDDKLVKAGFEAILKPVADLIEKLAGPAEEELGFAARDHVRVFRLKRQLRLLQRTKEMLEEAGTEPNRVPLKILAPVIESASLEEDNDLQDKWAALLANAATATQGIHPAYIEILKQLRSREVLVLELLFQKTTVPEQDRNVISEEFYITLAKTFGYADLPRTLLAAKIDYALDISGMIGNLTRLGLILVESIQHGPTYYKLTGFGTKFCWACKPPEKPKI
jgi:hypothetical protein